MFSRQNPGSLCMGDHSRWPKRTSCLYFSKELNLFMLSFSPSSRKSSAFIKSYKISKSCRQEIYTIPKLRDTKYQVTHFITPCLGLQILDNLWKTKVYHLSCRSSFADQILKDQDDKPHNLWTVNHSDH